jgi:hypothetical protein
MGNIRSLSGYINGSPDTEHSIIKNNILVAQGGAPGTGGTTGTYAIYLSGNNTQAAHHDIDYNCYYSSGTNLAYVGRSAGEDLMLEVITSWNTEVIDKQPVAINVSLLNNGGAAITGATIGWSVNGVDNADFIYTPSSSPLTTAQKETVTIGSFTASSNISDYYDVVVWIKDINGGTPDPVSWNDTVKASATLVSLAEFVAPFMPNDTIGTSFTVYADIKTWTGITSPQELTIVSTQGSLVIYDTVPMVQSGDTWQATIPQRHYGSKVVYTLSLTDNNGSSIILKDSTYISSVMTIVNDPNLAELALTEPITITTTGCMGDSSAIKVSLENKSTTNYDFSKDTLTINYEIVNPLSEIYQGSILRTNSIAAGTIDTIELLSALAVFREGSYDIKVWLSSPSDNTPCQDTLKYTYTSNRISLPIDEDFSAAGISTKFAVDGNTSNRWNQQDSTISVVKPEFGSGVLSFSGSRGAMSTLYTRQLDLTLASEPSLSFWYFHDTVASEDYTDVRVSIDGGATYLTLISLTKYDATYGWKQYSMDLPSSVNNPCVTLAFEAMEKSKGNVTQYIDRIFITAKQDIAISRIILPELAACDLDGKTIDVVMLNGSIPELDFTTTPTTLSLEIWKSGQIQYRHDILFDNGILHGKDSILTTMATDFDFTVGNYIVKAYFSSVLDVNRSNDTLAIPVELDLQIAVEVIPESVNPSCLIAGAESPIWQRVIIKNTGKMDLSNFGLRLQIDTGDNVISEYIVIRDTCTYTIAAGDSATYEFLTSYNVPWSMYYDVRVRAWLLCDSGMVNNNGFTRECVDVSDLQLVKIENPSTGKDTITNPINVTVTIFNTNDLYDFPSSDITVVVTNSQGIEMETITETIDRINQISETSYTFNNAYTVPNDSVYYLKVYLNSYDSYSYNDTLPLLRRETVIKQRDTTAIRGIEGIDGFTLGQNIPNPATNSTRIDFTVPEAGKVIFNVHNSDGQLLHSRTVEAVSGKNSLELNVNTLAAGVYLYSIEYKGKRLIRRMSIQ